MVNRGKHQQRIRFAAAVFLLAGLGMGASVAARAESLSWTNGLVLWLKADAGVVTQASGVAQWLDQSGQAADAVQTDTNRMPAFVPSAFSNGLPALRFVDHADNLLDDRLDGPSVVAGNVARTVFIVARENIATTANVSMLVLGRAGQSSTNGSVYRITPELGVRVYGNCLFQNHSLDERFRVIMVQNVAPAWTTNITARLDGIPLKPSSRTTTALNTDTSGYRIGDSEGGGMAAFTGDIAEVLVYQSWLTASNLNAVGCYLEQKYGLQTMYVPPSREARPVKVWLLAGQSNMRGHGNPSQITDPVYQAAQGDVMHWHNQDNEVAYQGSGRDYGWQQLLWNSGRTEADTLYGGFGPELSFGRTMTDTFPERRLALIKHAIGATSLHTDWNVASNGPRYVDFLRTVHAALAALTNMGFRYEIDGMLWMQGESDANTNGAPSYATNLLALVSAVRQEFNAPAMAFILGRTRGTNEYAVMVREAQMSVAEQDPLGAWVDVDDLPLVAYDTIHLNTAAQLEFGRRLARAYLDRIQPRQIQRIAPDAGGGAPALSVAWGSYTGEHFHLLFTEDLMAPWTEVATDIPAAPPLNLHTQQLQGCAAGFYSVERQP